MSKTESCEKQKEAHSRHRSQRVQKPEVGKSLAFRRTERNLVDMGKVEGSRSWGHHLWWNEFAPKNVNSSIRKP